MESDTTESQSLRDAFAPWRHLHKSRAEVEAQLCRIRTLEAQGRLEEAIVLAEATLEYDPYHRELLLWLIRVHAARGDREEHRRHLVTAFYVERLDAKSALNDVSLRGQLPDSAFEAAVREAEKRMGRDRPREYFLTEIEPQTDDFGTTLRWATRDAGPVRAALREFCAHAIRVTHQWPGDVEWWMDRVVVETSIKLGDETLPGNCHLGKIAVLLQDLAPYVDDVRVYLHDQTSPLFEVWVVAHASYVRRHDILASEKMWEYLDDLLQRENITDVPLQSLMIEHLADRAAAWIDASHPLELRQRAREIALRLARIGQSVPAFSEEVRGMFERSPVLKRALEAGVLDRK